MEIIEKNHTSLGNKNIIKSHANSDRLFIDTSAELLREGHGVKFRAPGDSMYPTICDGDVITVMPIETASISIGDIILYRHKSGVTAHRTVYKAKRDAPHSQNPALKPRPSVLSPQSYFILRGDAAIVFDDPIRADQILGKIVSIERNGRSIDPYCLRIKLTLHARRLASCLKKFFIRPRSSQPK